ncbi:MAG TPA: PKD domain-containing protein, partial [Flavobacteriales bacterium]|nr:PKD domain-containing protein [Flavobacteriales bacterium]
MSSKTIRIVLAIALALFWGSGMELFGQPFPIFNGTDVTCVGAFLDSGGQGGTGYGNNENYIYTLCPDDPTGAISLNFITFNLNTAGAAPGDVMVIHDGNSVADPILGSWTGTALQGLVVSASAGNSSGCLTIEFTSNATGLGVFAASITCYQPCTRPTAVATHGAVGAQRICPGESVTFNSAGSYAAPGFSIATRRWVFGDGTFLNNAPASVNHTYTQPGGYIAQLELVDNNGCASTNLVDLLIEVGTIPSFDGTGGPLVGCPGETICLDGDVNGTTWTENPTPGLGSGVFLPDNVGSCFNSTVTYNQFTLGQTLTNVNGLLSICMSMEHSFIGDLVITIISPTGESVVMHQQGGLDTYLGIPIDDDLTPNAQGTCWNYCFSPTATNGTWVDNAQATLPTGTYESLNPLSGLVGSSLNGTWTLQVCDLWAQDNGFICDWNMDFAPSLFADLIEFTPVYGAGCDSSSWSGANISSTTGNCNQICITPPGVGNFPYVYTVQDNFGCTYDTTITVSIVQGPQVNAGANVTTCGDPVQLGATITSGGIASPCNYTLTLNDTWGDGWFGGSGVTITVNGVPTAWTLPNGSTGSVAVPVNNGEAISLNYTAAFLFNGEQSFTLTNSSGTVVYNSGNGPASGLSWSGTAICPNGGMVYSWSPATGLSDPNISNPLATVGSTTTYCVTVYQMGHPDCATTDCVDVLFDNPADPGINGNITVCETSSPINLFSQLGGTPEVGGAWTTPSSTPHSGNFIPGTDVPGFYTYTTTGTGACGPATASATVEVIVNLLTDAGDNGDVTVCSNAGPAGLFAELEGTPIAGGTWSGPSPIIGDAFDPSTMNGGLYTYTVPSPAPCPAATAEVFVVIEQPVDAGTDGAIVLCSTNGPASLFAQLGGAPAAGGIWTGPSAVVGGMFDPATMTAGDYTYTVTGTA